jgi:hypothetical protein
VRRGLLLLAGRCGGPAQGRCFGAVLASLSCALLHCSICPAPQVFSAICVMFAHGAGEVGYMTGPLGAIWQVGRRASDPARAHRPLRWAPPFTPGACAAQGAPAALLAA